MSQSNSFKDNVLTNSCVLFIFSAAVRQGIVDMMDRALTDPAVKSVVICGQNGKFCGGMDSYPT